MTDLATMAKDVARDPLSPAAFEGKSLGDAFYELVVRDRRFWDAIHAVGATSWKGIKCQAFRTDVLFPSRSGLWPLQVGTFDLLNGWFSPDHWQHGERVESPSEPDPIGYPWYTPDDGLEVYLAAELVISSVLDRFLAPLRAGTVVATGHADRGHYQPVPLLSAVWERPDTRMNIRASSVEQVTGWVVDTVDRDGELQYFRHHKFKPEFSAITLNTKQSPAAIDAKTRSRDKGKIKWDYALDQMMCKLHGGKKYARRNQFVQEFLGLINDGQEKTEATQVYTFFCKYYPTFWELLKED